MSTPIERNTESKAEPRHGARDTMRAAGKVFEEMSYPHGIHPALVPGVDIEQQRMRYGIDKLVVGVVAVVVAAFIVWGIVNPDQVLEVSSAGVGWVMTNLGWVFSIIAIGALFFLLALAFSRYGRIPLGLDGEGPEYSTVSWAAMLFGAGIGIGIIFWGPLEPLTYYVSPLPGLYEPASVEAVKGAMAQAILHWGPSAWAIYAVVGLTVAYVSFRKGRVPLMSSVLAPLWGGHSKDPGSRIIDSLAILATLFGTAAALGIGALQIGQGVSIVSGWSAEGNTLALIVIVVLTIGTIVSAVSGIAKGIRWLSNINLVLAMILALFFFVMGPTVFLMNIVPGVFVEYFNNMLSMLSATTEDSEATKTFLTSWTAFYWAWWVSWAPFVGVFTAKISRGRTIRQFVLGVILIPSTIVGLAFIMLGGTAIWFQHNTGKLVDGNDPANLPAPEAAFFEVLNLIPNANWIIPIVIVMLAIFFITSSDSASLVNSQFSQQGNPRPKRAITALWAVLMAGISAVMLLTGGRTGLQGMQNMVIISAFPFAIVLIAMAVALLRELRRDPMMIRAEYEQTAVSNAVRHGIAEHGDNFELSIDPVDPDNERGVGHHFDSTAQEVTEWYTRTDEDGNPIDFDYTRGHYFDEDGNPVDAEGNPIELDDE